MLDRIIKLLDPQVPTNPPQQDVAWDFHITDNGAGGLSSSVGEMADECNGCRMDLAKAPLKYAGMQPWEILVSEAQERMSFAVPPEKIDEFKQLAAERDVEVSVLGEFTDNGKFHMLYNGKTVAYNDINFMHDGLPKMHLKATWKTPEFPEPELAERDLAADTMSSPNTSASSNVSNRHTTWISSAVVSSIPAMGITPLSLAALKKAGQFLTVLWSVSAMI